MSDLKLVYVASTEETAMNELELFKDKWDFEYLKIYKSWRDNWTTLFTYFKYPEAVTRLIYITNAIGGNPQLWKEAKRFYHMGCNDVRYGFDDYVQYVKKRFLRLVVLT